MLAQSRGVAPAAPGTGARGREPDNPYTIAERRDPSNRATWIVLDPTTRLGIAELKYLSSAVDLAVLVWAGDCNLPIKGVLPLLVYSLPDNGKEIGATFQPSVSGPLGIVDEIERRAP